MGRVGAAVGAWAAALALAGCLDPTVRERGMDLCEAELRTLVVSVVDAAGAPAGGAVVSAQQLDTGQTFTAMTDGDGQTRALTEDVGAGTLRLSAARGPKVSRPAEVAWACDGCNCTPEPAAVQLQLSP